MHSVQSIESQESLSPSPQINWVSVVKRRGAGHTRSPETKPQLVTSNHHRGESSQSSVSDSDVRFLNNVENLNDEQERLAPQAGTTDDEERKNTTSENENSSEMSDGLSTASSSTEDDEQITLSRANEDAGSLTMESGNTVVIYNIEQEEEEDSSEEQSTTSETFVEPNYVRYKYQRTTRRSPQGEDWVTSTVVGRLDRLGRVTEDDYSRKSSNISTVYPNVRNESFTNVQNQNGVQPPLVYQASRASTPSSTSQNVSSISPSMISQQQYRPAFSYPMTNSPKPTNNTIKTKNMSSVPNQTNVAQTNSNQTTAPIVNNLVNHGAFMNMNAYTALNVPNMMYYPATSRSPSIPQGNVMMKQDGVFYSMQYNPALPHAYTVCAPFNAYANPVAQAQTTSPLVQYPQTPTTYTNPCTNSQLLQSTFQYCHNGQQTPQPIQFPRQPQSISQLVAPATNLLNQTFHQTHFSKNRC